MPRQARIDTTGALHHVIARGIEQTEIFKDHKDRYLFLNRLDRILQETETGCYAWALMPNHFHLLLRTGAIPISTVMRRLLTGHATSFNNRHGRHGHVFQNRYKSILCQEEIYFTELVRYIHLNPLRAGLVEDLDNLDRYPFSGHGVIMGNHRHAWHNYKEVLSYFADHTGAARKKYRDFIAKGIGQGRRKDLTGGGLARSMGGWAPVNEARKSGANLKSDERILGDPGFVKKTLSQADESFERKYVLKARGVDVDYIAAKVAAMLGMANEDVWTKGRHKRVVAARSLICYLAVRELGVTMTSLAGRLGISTVAISKSVQRGAKIIKEQNYDINKLIS
ncbi:MAG: transposase [Desulfosalsimonas sp.]